MRSTTLLFITDVKSKIRTDLCPFGDTQLFLLVCWFCFVSGSWKKELATFQLCYSEKVREQIVPHTENGTCVLQGREKRLSQNLFSKFGVVWALLLLTLISGPGQPWQTLCRNSSPEEN